MQSKRLLFLLTMSTLFVTCIPAVGYFSALLIQNNIDKKVVEAFQKNDHSAGSDFSITELCTIPGILDIDPKLAAVCGELEQLNTLEYWSLITGAVGLAYLLLVLLSSVLARNNRILLVSIFKPALRLSQLAISFLVIAHGGILIAAIYFTESYWLGRVHFLLLGIVGLVIGLTALKILGSIFAKFKSIETKVLGRALLRKNSPKLWNLIDEVASLAKTSPPDNLIVGMSPTFFVTEANVNNLDGVSKGRTLYLSLPFCRLLTPNELKAIIAHELGHFVGLDTRFSRHFYPIYRGAAHSMTILNQQTEGEGGLHTLAILPSTFLMAYFIESFSTAESEISRSRELAADELAGIVVSKEDIASALVKVHAYANIWSYTESKMLDAISEGKQLNNASKFFELVALNLTSDFVSRGLEESHTEHPTDSHPPLKVRLDALSFKLNQELILKISRRVEINASTVIDNVEELEKQLTEFEHEKISRGVVTHTSSEDASFRQILLRSMILMMLIDDKVTDEEINTLKALFEKVTGEKLIDAEIKMEMSKAKDWAGSLFDYIKQCEVLLKSEAKDLLLKSLILMASSDGEFHEEEKNLVAQVSIALEVKNEHVKKILDELFE